MRRCQSGQLEWTVNPSASAYAGSNPARRTTENPHSFYYVDFVYVSLV